MDRDPASPAPDELEDDGSRFSHDSSDEDDLLLDSLYYSDDDSSYHTESDESQSV